MKIIFEDLSAIDREKDDKIPLHDIISNVLKHENFDVVLPNGRSLTDCNNWCKYDTVNVIPHIDIESTLNELINKNINYCENHMVSPKSCLQCNTTYCANCQNVLQNKCPCCIYEIYLENHGKCKRLYILDLIYNNEINYCKDCDKFYYTFFAQKHIHCNHKYSNIYLKAKYIFEKLRL